MSINLAPFDQYYQVPKAWGSEIWLVNREQPGLLSGYCAKLLSLAAGWQCSLHCHQQKDETFFVLEGTIELYIMSGQSGQFRQTMLLGPGMSYHISPGVYHRFSATEPALILEVSSPHSDLDVIRKEPSNKLSSSQKELDLD